MMDEDPSSMDSAASAMMSTATGQQKKNLRSCDKCPARLSSLDYDVYTVCYECSGQKLVSVRCVQCQDLSDLQMKSYVKRIRILDLQRIARQNRRVRDRTSLILTILLVWRWIPSHLVLVGSVKG